MRVSRRPIAPSASCAPVGRSPGRSDPQSGRWLLRLRLSRRISHKRGLQRDRADYARRVRASRRPTLRPQEPDEAANGGVRSHSPFGPAFFNTALFMGSIPLPIVITKTLGGAESDVGSIQPLRGPGISSWAGSSAPAQARRTAGDHGGPRRFRALLHRPRTGALGRSRPLGAILRAIAIALVTYSRSAFCNR